ncbi:MAG: hypothetical protein RMK93_08565, partial [Bacteroidota bacterium]|nr:hypothetical protein [Bacteroidota bacterium]
LLTELRNHNIHPALAEHSTTIIYGVMEKYALQNREPAIAQYYAQLYREGREYILRLRPSEAKELVSPYNMAPYDS